MVNKVLIAVVFLFALTGCYDKVELEDRGFIMTIGIDKYQEDDTKTEVEEDGKKNQENEKNGENFNIAGYSEKDSEKSEEENKDKDISVITFDNEEDNNRFTVTINRANSQQEGSESSRGNSTIVANSDTIAGAINLINLYSNQHVYLGYAEAIVISESILRDPELFKEVVDTLERHKEVSREIFIVTTEGKASDSLLENLKSDKMLGMFISKFYRNNNSFGSSRVFHKNLEDLSKSLRQTGHAIIPKLATDNGNVKLNGVAVIKDFKLVDWLNGSSIKGYLWVLGKGEGITISVEANDTFVPLNINKNTKKVTFRENNDQLICEINLKINGTIEGYNFTEVGLFDENLLDELSRKYEEVITNEVKETFHLFQDVYMIDGFEFFEMLRKRDNDLYEKFKDLKGTPEAMVLDINVVVEIKSIGAIK